MLYILNEKFKIGLEEIKFVKMLDGIYRKTLVFNENLMFCQFLLEKNATIPIHTHISSQAGFVLRGKIRFEIEEGGKMEQFITKKGDSYIFNSNQKHGAFILEEAEVIEAFAPYREEYI